MRIFQHPHLTRGIVTTAKGSFVVIRGLVEMPDEIGEELGWRPVDADADTAVDAAAQALHTPEATEAAPPRNRT
jgi:hypothetical protein